MEVKNIKTKALKPYSNNPRRNAKAVPAVKESILKFGFKVPLVIDKNNVIVCGHTRFYASKEIGLETVPCIVADDLTDEQINAFRLVDNRVSEFADWNFDDSQISESQDALKSVGNKTLNISKFITMLANLNYELNTPGFHDIYVYFEVK